MAIRWSQYPAAPHYDELIAPGGLARAGAETVARHLEQLGSLELSVRQKAAEAAVKGMGITFTVYHEEGGSIDRAWPLDIIPRVIEASEWRLIEAGLRQRARALNMFIDDIYHAQRIVNDGVFPRQYLLDSANFRSQCVGISPPLGVRPMLVSIETPSRTAVMLAPLPRWAISSRAGRSVASWCTMDSHDRP
jgi:uncharacterized circularly permuted ATP-grasp superfamily protein